MRLIDADALSKLVGEPIEVFLRRLDLKLPPTVDAEPKRHGHWDCKGFEPVRCSVCGITVDAINGIPWANIGFKFCPHCGAKMDEVTENG